MGYEAAVGHNLGLVLLPFHLKRVLLLSNGLEHAPSNLDSGPLSWQETFCNVPISKKRCVTDPKEGNTAPQTEQCVAENEATFTNAKANESLPRRGALPMSSMCHILGLWCACACKYVSIYTYICTYIHIYIGVSCMYTYIDMYVYMCMCIYIHICRLRIKLFPTCLCQLPRSSSNQAYDTIESLGKRSRYRFAVACVERHF